MEILALIEGIVLALIGAFALAIYASPENIAIFAAWVRALSLSRAAMREERRKNRKRRLDTQTRLEAEYMSEVAEESAQ